MECILIKVMLSAIAMLIQLGVGGQLLAEASIINIDQGCVASVDKSKYIQNTGKCTLPVNDISDKDACLLHFSQITFPGTHNSGAYKLILNSKTEADKCFFLNQNLNITEQLKLGIRALDLDVTEKDGEVRLMHGCDKLLCATGITLECALNDIMRFLLQKRDQTILVIRILNHSKDSISWPNDFRWNSTGKIPDWHCVQINEPSDTNVWQDNFFCSKKDIGMKWSYKGEIDGMNCTQIHEASDGVYWQDNYLCVPYSSTLNLKWSSNDTISNTSCVQWLEKSDPNTWNDNYLCAEQSDVPAITSTSLITKILETINSTLGDRILNRYTDPTIESALTDQRPVFFYIHRELWESLKTVQSPELKKLADYLRPAQTTETWSGTNNENITDCNLKAAVIKYLDKKNDILQKYPWVPTYIDWFRFISKENIKYSFACNNETAKMCNDDARIKDARDVAQHLLVNYNRTVNILQTDYTGQETIDEAKEINEKNIKHFVIDKKGAPKKNIPKSFQTSKYPFIHDNTKLEIADKYPV